jgi:hypothetical protein
LFYRDSVVYGRALSFPPREDEAKRYNSGIPCDCNFDDRKEGQKAAQLTDRILLSVRGRKVGAERGRAGIEEEG